jgi:hypothetical protein
MMRFTLLLFLASVSSLTFAASDAPGKESVPPLQSSDRSTGIEEVVVVIEDAHIARNLLQVGAMLSGRGKDSPRHRQEKAHLMKRMDRKSGKWGKIHPRYRLLEALWGYSRYRERNMAELERWRTLYKSVSKKQKKVSCCAAEHM